MKMEIVGVRKPPHQKAALKMNVTVAPGVGIEDAAMLLEELADRYECVVECDFNGTRMYCIHGEAMKDVLIRWGNDRTDPMLKR